MQKAFKAGDRVFIKSQGDCIRATVLSVDSEEITVQLEEISHTPVIAKYPLDHLLLCDDISSTKLTTAPAAGTAD